MAAGAFERATHYGYGLQFGSESDRLIENPLYLVTRVLCSDNLSNRLAKPLQQCGGAGQVAQKAAALFPA